MLVVPPVSVSYGGGFGYCQGDCLWFVHYIPLGMPGTHYVHSDFSGMFTSPSKRIVAAEDAFVRKIGERFFSIALK